MLFLYRFKRIYECGLVEHFRIIRNIYTHNINKNHLAPKNITNKLSRQNKIQLDEFFRNSIFILLIGYIISFYIMIGEFFLSR